MQLRASFLVVLIALVPATAPAQTSDIFFGGWSWRPRDQGSRPAGMAGTYVAVADSVRTTAINPAGLALIPRVEGSAGIGPLWAGIGKRLQTGSDAPPATRPTQPDNPVPCPPPRRARPWAAGLYVEQADTQTNQLEAVLGPGVGATATLDGTTEELGGGLAKGLTPWLDVGATVAWRHLRFDGRSIVSDALGREQQRITLAGDANKARAIVGALATFGPAWAPTALRVGVAYQWDLLDWTVERTLTDRARGVAGQPTSVAITEPPVLSAGVAWRFSDTWLIAGQLDYTWYDRVAAAIQGTAGPSDRFTARDHFEPRGAIEMTRSSPLGGYYKLRAGLRREVSGRVAYEGPDPVLRQAFLGTPTTFRGSVGASFLAEFYEKAVRLDVDLSQVVLQRQSSLSAAGSRRLSISLTGRL